MLSICVPSKWWRRKDGFEETRTIGPELEVYVSHRFDQYRMEIRVVSMNNDGSPSWIVISRRMNKYVKYPLHAWKTISSKKEELEIGWRFVKVCYQFVLKCFHVARIERLGILWSVYKLARVVTKWTRAGDRRLVRLISYIHHTSDHRPHCHVGDTAHHCRLGLCQDCDFAGKFQDTNSTSERLLRISGSWSYVVVSWMCKKQTSVPHSSTEFKVVSLDAGLRMDGLTALDLWELLKYSIIPQAYHCAETRGETKPKQNTTTPRGRNTSIEMILKIFNVDHVNTNAKPSHVGAFA